MANGTENTLLIINQLPHYSWVGSLICDQRKALFEVSFSKDFKGGSIRGGSKGTILNHTLFVFIFTH